MIKYTTSGGNNINILVYTTVLLWTSIFIILSDVNDGKH